MFPEIIPARQVRGAIDGFVDHLVTNYADTLETLSQPVLHALVWLEQLLRSSPWWAVVAVTVAIAWGVSRRIGLSLAMGALLCVIGVLGLWDAGMQTLALMIMAAGLSVIIGIPLGVLMARVNWLRSIMLPVIRVMGRSSGVKWPPFSPPAFIHSSAMACASARDGTHSAVPPGRRMPRPSSSTVKPPPATGLIAALAQNRRRLPAVWGVGGRTPSFIISGCPAP